LYQLVLLSQGARYNASVLCKWVGGAEYTAEVQQLLVGGHKGAGLVAAVQAQPAVGDVFGAQCAASRHLGLRAPQDIDK
jgi:hypothetical protein